MNRVSEPIRRRLLALGLAWVGIVAARTVLPDPLLLSFLVPASEAAFILIAGYGLGHLAVRLLRWEVPDRSDRLFFTATLGLGLAALVTFGIGSLGLLRKGIVVPLLGGAALLGGWSLLRELRRPRQAGTGRDGRAGPVEAFLVAAGAVAAGLYLLAALAPPTFFDSMVYHLALPDRFARSGRIAADPDFVFSFFPLNMEMLYTLGRVLFADHRTANLLNFGAGLLLVLGTARVGHRLGGPRAARLAAAALLLTPAFGLLAVVPKHDLALALFELAAFLAWCRWHFDGDRRGLASAGIFAGLACGTKYAGIYFLIALLLATAIRVAARDRRRLVPYLRGAAIAAVIAAALFAPWWGRNLALTGNPVYPTLQGLFPSAERLNPDANRVSIEKGGRRDLVGLARAPWDMTFRPGDFRFFSQIGPFYLALLLPLLLWGRRRPEIPLLLLTVGIALPLWWMTRPNTRYFLGCLALLAAAAAALLVRLLEGDRWVRAVAGGFLVLLVPVNLVAFLSVERSLFDSIGLVLGVEESREEYLARRLDYYPGAQFVNEALPADAVVLMIGETRTYYIERPVRVSSAHNRSLPVRFATGAQGPADLRSILEREGITHLLVNEREGRRLAAGYAYFDFPDRASRAAFEGLLRRASCPLFRSGVVAVLRLGPCADRSPGRTVPARDAGAEGMP